MKKIVANLAIVLLVIGLFQITLQVTPVVFSGQSVAYKEVWKLVEVNNTLPDLTFVDVNITVSSREGVNIACSTNITEYFENTTAQEKYLGWMNWLNGTSEYPYNWGVMDWFVSHSGSLTSITFDQIQYWGAMYADSGGGVDYTTFMGNTYMADWNLTHPGHEPDIISISEWEENRVMIISDLLVPAKTKIYIAFKIVITVSGVYVFDVAEPPDVIISPSSWRIGGVKTLFVGSQPSDEYQSIQEAINNATTGDTVTVDSGGYDGFEANVTGIAVKAASGEKPVINGTAATGAAVDGQIVGVLVSAHNVTIQGLTINGSYSTGIQVYNATTPPHGAKILDNTVDMTWYDPNTISGCTYGGGCIQAKAGSGATTIIEDNDVAFNVADTYGHEGIASWGMHDADVIIRGNTVNISSTGSVNKYHNGIVLHGTGNAVDEGSAVIDNNTVSVVELGEHMWRHYGIYILGLVENEYLNNVNITNNIVTGPGYCDWATKSTGYALRMSGPETKNIDIMYNDFKDYEFGMVVENDASCTDVHVNYNNITGNDHGIATGVTYTITVPTLDATLNWWGNWTGPSPRGDGNGVTDKVEFEPWLIQPYPPAVQVSNIYIDPNSTQYWTPAYGSTFNIHVKANVTLLAGFQFNLTWDGTLLNLVRADWSPLWEPYTTSESNTTNSYLLGSAAQSSASEPYPFNGSATLATLTFKVIYDSISENVTCDLALEDVILGAPGVNKIIPRLVYNGTYSCNATKPKLALMPPEKVVKGVPLDFDVKVNVTNVVNLYAFEFNLTYDPALIEGLRVDVKPFFNASYDITEAYVNNTGKFVFVRVNSIDPPANGSGTLTIVTFRVKNSTVWSSPPDPPLSCNLTFYDSKLITAGPTEIAHDVEDGTYIYDPVKGDVNRDGTVGIEDLTRVALTFGTREGDLNWNYIKDYDLIRDDVINILDVIVVASNFGSQG